MVPLQTLHHGACLVGSVVVRYLPSVKSTSVYVQGELISESGTMTGGGGKPRRGKMRLGSGAPAAAASDEGKDVIVLERDLQQLQKVPTWRL